MASPALEVALEPLAAPGLVALCVMRRALSDCRQTSSAQDRRLEVTRVSHRIVPTTSVKIAHTWSFAIPKFGAYPASGSQEGVRGGRSAPRRGWAIGTFSRAIADRKRRFPVHSCVGGDVGMRELSFPRQDARRTCSAQAGGADRSLGHDLRCHFAW